jgi:hypothetical protein
MRYDESRSVVRWIVGLCLGMVLSASPAWAQTEVEPGVDAAAAPLDVEPAAEGSAVPVAEDGGGAGGFDTEGEIEWRCVAQPDADACWSIGLNLLAADAWLDARSAFRAFARAFPDDRRAGRASALADALVDASEGTEETGLLQQNGRIELVVFSTLYGATLGGLTASMASDTTRAVVLASAGTGIAGLTASLLATQGRPVTASQAALISSSTVWGGALGVIGTAAFLPDDALDFPVAEAIVGGSLVGLAGGVAGAIVYPELPRGDISFVNSMGFWTGTTTVLTALLVTNGDVEGRPLFQATLATTVLGLGGGALLARSVDVSANRMRLINLGGGLGTALAAGLVVLDDDPSVSSVTGALLVGEILGLGAATLLTHNRRGRSARSDAAGPDDGPDFTFTAAPTLLSPGPGQRSITGIALGGQF